MATTNLDAPMGLRPMRNTRGGSYPQIEELYAGTLAIYEGDMLWRGADGLVVTVTHTATASENAQVGVAAAYLAAGTASDRKIPVYNDPTQRYVVQADNASAVPVQRTAYVGKNFGQLVTVGSTTTLQSRHELDSSSGSTVAGSLRVHDVWGGLENRMVLGSATDSTFVKFVVSIVFAKHHYGGGAAV